MNKSGQEITTELDNEFVDLVKEIKEFLISVKSKFDSFDTNNTSQEAQRIFVENNKNPIFDKLTAHFHSVWKIVNKFDNLKYQSYADFYRKELGSLLLEAEVNKHIYSRPLGYAGDYITMQHIYDYHDKYLGKSSYNILINNYTCNIPISNSNIKRKRYFKEKILEILSNIKFPRIASFGSGPARELIELLDEGKILGPFQFYCVDFEIKALEFVKMELKKRKIDNSIRIDFIKIDIRNLVRAKKIKEKIKDLDFLYASGLFDYLSDRFAQKAVSILLELLKKNGKMIIVNASAENSEMRAYYEFLGNWVFRHRTKKDLLGWVKSLESSIESEFEEPYPPNNYLYLKINR